MQGSNGKGLQYLCLDACYDEEDEEEEEAFNEAMEELYEKLNKAPKLSTNEVNENVRSDHGKLKKKRLQEEEETEKENTKNKGRT